MRLHSVRLSNFRQHADTFIEFDTGLTGIIGRNGAGKTTILEAIAWALYGNPAARGTRDSIRFSRAGARATVRVELDFELGGHRYLVKRGLTSAELVLDGAAQPIATTITGVSDLLHRRLGMTRAEFFNTYFTGQKELNVMAAMGPAERAQFLSRVLGYDRLRTAQALVRDRRRLIAAETMGLRAGMTDPDAVARALADAEARVSSARTRATEAGVRHAQSAAELAGLEPQWIDAQHARERLAELLGELRVAESEEGALARDLVRLDRELAEIAVGRDELERVQRALLPLATLSAELAQLDEQWRQEGRRQTLQDSERVAREEIARLRERLERLDTAPALEIDVTAELGTRRLALEAQQTLFDERHTVWVRDRQEAETRREALREQYAELKEQRERLVTAGEEGICPTCARPLGGHFRSVLDLLDGQLETVGVDGKYFRDRLEQLAGMPDDVKALDVQRHAMQHEVSALERKLTKVQLGVQERASLARDVVAKEERLAAVLSDLSTIPAGYDVSRHRDVRAAVDRLTPLGVRAQRLGALTERAPALAEERARVTTMLDAARARLAALRDRRAAGELLEPGYSEVRTRYEALLAAVRGAELAAVAATSEVAAAVQTLERAETDRREQARVQERLAGLQRDRRLHDELDRAFTDLRTELNVALRPELSELASAFLTELTDARYSEIEIDEQYNVTVLEDGVPKPVISGGEEDVANLVLRLAISQMIADRAGQAFSLLILDEVFGSLDEPRRHGVLDLLRGLHDRFEQVILITHIESVREGLDRVISVRYDEARGSSVVEQSDRLRGGDDLEDAEERLGREREELGATG